jgi:hypothetical protein
MDHPRFEPIQGHRDSLHLAYHGGNVVELVLGLIDRRVIKAARTRYALTAPISQQSRQDFTPDHIVHFETSRCPNAKVTQGAFDRERNRHMEATMQSSTKLAVPIVLATAAIAAAAMFSIQPPPSSQAIASASDRESSTHVSAAMSAGNLSEEAAFPDSSRMIWLPLTADGQ